MGKDAGKDLGFIESLTDVAQKREIQFDEYSVIITNKKKHCNTEVHQG